MPYSDQESHYYTGNKENMSIDINIALSLSTLNLPLIFASTTNRAFRNESPYPVTLKLLGV